MIDLLPEEHSALRCVIRAGGEGAVLGSDITASQAIRLALDDLVRFEPAADGPQRVIVTAKGAAFARRVTA